MRGVFACRFRAAHLVVKNPRFVGTKRHRASPLELTCDVLPLSVRPLRPNAPSQTCVFSGRIVDLLCTSGLLFGQLTTDASLQACACFGRIMALSRFERFFLRSTRDRRSTHDRRIAPGVRLLRPNHGPAPRQAVFSSVTPISDRLGVRAPKAIRAKAVTYRAEGHFGD
jgi:hypothetical protein